MKFSINFMKYRKIFLTISAVLMAGSLLFLLIRGLNLSIDFTGGNVIQVELSKNEKISVGDVREVVDTVFQGNSMIQEFGDTAFIIRTQDDGDDARIKMLNALKMKYPEMEILGLEKVGPVVGAELRHEAYVGMVIALVAILLYITFRFQFRFAVVSVMALVHDTVLVLGAFSLAGMEVNTSFIAAILTVVGYSINATIIILDRIRENWKDLPTKRIVQLVNDSTNQTLSRTINTTLTTICPVIALFVWGGPVLSSFSFALLIGLIVGTYSSICISTSLLCEWWLKRPISGK
ncbi:MAG: protein translocase subunit SecF [Synergistaceae bacterium]|nr:protein translocase subunit SecF [Synergistaceae bacterium]